MKKVMFKRVVALIITFVLLFTGIGVVPVHAETEESLLGTVISQSEEVAEGIVDAKSTPSAGPWWQALADGFWWNSFHNQVQKHIVDISNRTIERELYITYGKENGNLEGKHGSADLYKQTDEKTYLWEVKPYSYSVDPKKSLGEEQLRQYVLSKKDLYRLGGKQIESGETGLFRFLHDGVRWNKVTYIIPYEVGSNSLILYKFRRVVSEEEPEPEYSGEIVAVPSYEKEFALEELVNPVPVYTYEDEGEVGNEETVDLGLLFRLLAVAHGLLNVHQKIQANPDTANSLSAAIVSACTSFIHKVMSALAGGKPSDWAVIRAAVYDFQTALDTYGGDELIEEAGASLWGMDSDEIDELIRGIQGESENYDKAGEAQPPRDPLIIDLGSMGIELHSLDNGVNFDLDNNGFAEKTAWTGTEDGFLALDRDNSGKIDNGGELFGDQVILKDGSKSSSGFEALAELDENQDKAIDSQDSIYDKLIVWIDSNHNGTSEEGELKGLADLNIVSVSLEHTETSFVDAETGARIAETANVEIREGETVSNAEISEFWFPVNSSDTTHGSTVTSGNVPSIEQALQEDETGELYRLVYAFNGSADIADKHYYLRQILYFLTDAEDISPDARGGNIDARKLKVIEEFMGREFSGVGGTNPNANAANILEEIYSSIENQYYSILNMYSELGAYLEVTYECKNDSGKNTLDMSFLNYAIEQKIAGGEDKASLVYDLGVYLKSYDAINATKYYDEYATKYASISPYYAGVVDMTKAGDTYIATAGNDTYTGSGINDFIFGQAGDDTLSGGKGYDSISGGEGNDTYVFARGYGNDVIKDGYGHNTIRLSGLKSDDIRVNGTGWFDATIYIKGTNDSLLIRDFRMDECNADFNLVFDDVTMHVTDEGSPFRYICGDDNDNNLQAVTDNSTMYGFGGNDSITGSDGGDIIYGNEGADVVYAGTGIDYIYGGTGDDTIYGEDGNDFMSGLDGDDILSGGTGNDVMDGGIGADTYLFGIEGGTDIVNDMEGSSTIELTDSLTLDDINVNVLGCEAIVSIVGTDDRLIIHNSVGNLSAYTLKTESDSISMADYISRNPDGASEHTDILTGSDTYDYMLGTEASEYIFGDGDIDRILAGMSSDVIFGGMGNDQLFGEAENDIIAGGMGDDYINGGDGADIIYGDMGNDFVDGGQGDDIYLFNAAGGNDSFMDSDGSNVIIFGDEIYASQIKAFRYNWNDLLITFAGLDDTLLIKNYCINEEARSFKLIFADGTVVYATAGNSPLKTIYGTDNGEYEASMYEDGVNIIGQDGDDQLTGSGHSDYLDGGAGNDRLTGNSGDDTLVGDVGDDYLAGGSGDDIYIYRAGDGADTISDGAGTNEIRIEGYNEDDVRAYRTNWNDMTMLFADETGDTDKLVIEGFFTAEANRNFYLNFGSHRIHATASDSPIRTIYGTEQVDYMSAMDDNGATLIGGEGSDTLNGGAGKDILYGGLGDDRIIAGAGDDIIYGEAGTDYLEGGLGNDAYIFKMGDGTDTINDADGYNTIAFGDGFLLENIKVYRTDWNDLTIMFDGCEDKLVIEGYFVSEENRNFSVEFADGNFYRYDSENNPIHQADKIAYILMRRT